MAESATDVTPLSPGMETWRLLPGKQQPQWPDAAELRRATAELRARPPLVSAHECDLLKERIAAVALGEAFILQGGDCAETFDAVTTGAILNKLTTLLQMAAVLTYAASVPVVKIGRIAGQYGKPRSQDTETRDGVTLPAYRGDSVNGFEFTAAARKPDPWRMVRTYHSSASTLNVVRAFVSGGRADLRQVRTWNRGFVAGSPAGERYELLAAEIDRALRFMEARGADPGELCAPEFYCSHEGLLLEYESALTRIDSRTGAPYNASAHFVWIGDRTRDPGGAHVEYFSKIRNPIGVKLGPTTSPDEVRRYLRELDPHCEPGRLTFVVRLGARLVRDLLPTLIEKIRSEGHVVAWVCDPMHGNTFEAPGGRKTRHFDDVLGEIRGFFEVHRDLGTHPGGIHIELTGDEVTECVGGGQDIVFDDLATRYESVCDPRLNRSQSLELAFEIAQLYPRQA